MKSVRIISTRTSSVVTIETDAENWGELKEQLSEDSRYSDINWAQTSVYMKDATSRKALAFPEDELSSLDTFKLFISPAQMKAGNVTRYSDANLKELLTKLTNVINDILTEDVQTTTVENPGKLTSSDRQDLEEINQSLY